MSEKNHPEIDNEVEHIQESTLIPESHFSTSMMEDPNEQVQVIPVSHASAAQQGEKPMATVLKNDPSFAKKNAPYIAVAAVAGLIIAAFALKGGDGSSLPQVAKGPAQVVQQPSLVAAAAPSATSTATSTARTSAPIEVNNASAPGSPAALDTPTSATTLPTAVKSADGVAPALVAVVPQPAAPIVPAADISRLEGQVKTNSNDVVDLKTRVDRLEAGAASSTAPNKPVGSTQPVATVKNPVVLSSHVHHRANGRSRQNTKSGRTAGDSGSRSADAAYSVHIVRDNLAWIRSPNGVISSYSIGDVIPGIGKLSKIDEIGHTVVAGNHKIK